MEDISNSRLIYLPAIAVLSASLMLPAHVANAASAESASNPCGRAVEALVAENPELEGQGVDFACTEDRVTVRSDEHGTYDSDLESLGIDELPQLRSSSDGGYTCRINGTPDILILDDLRAGINMCIFYGRQNDPVTGTWTRSINMEFVFNLGQDAHRWRASGFMNEGKNAELMGSITLQKQNGILPPRDVDQTWLSAGAPSFGFNGVTEAGDTGTFALRLDQFAVTDGEKAFSLEVAGSAVTKRFYCAPREQCRYPDGEQAPI